MRLALKIFLANLLVILVLVGVAVWTLAEVARLISADRQVAVRSADALRVAASLRERVVESHRLELRALVFADREYVKVPQTEAARTQQGLDLLGTFLVTDAEREAWQEANRAFTEYRAAVAKSREARTRGQNDRASQILETEGGPAAARVSAALERLTEMTSAGLNESQRRASSALGLVQSEVNRLRDRTWLAVVVALVTAVLVALAGSAFLAVRMTRSLRRLAAGTTALAEGSFQPIRVESSDEIGALARSFNRMAARLHEVDQLKEQFYASVSHELRSPLTSAREAAHFLLQGGPGPLTEKQAKLVSIIHGSTDRLLRLVSQVLDVSRLSAGLLPIERGWFDIERAARRAVKEVRVQAQERGVDVRLDGMAAPIEVYADEDRVVQILVNLLGNGVRFTPAGGSVIVRILDSGADVELQVQDTGIGIPSGTLPVVFERYRQAHTGYGGTGLGLTIVRGLVEAHGGRVSVESEETKGTRFTVFLPRKPADAPPPPEAHAA
jgi:signal transduction histidine kinase